MNSPLQALKHYWGFDSFRPPQDDIVSSVLNGNDTIALLPTGAGKSICFQLPAVLFDGITIVISPLIALMLDQVQHLKQRNIAAECLHSGLHRKDIDRILDNCIYGQVKILYVSPERLFTDLFQQRVLRMNVSLLAVDEAHCISQWGYDFRPTYLKISSFKQFIQNVPIIALTATATPIVLKEIMEKLELSDEASLFQSSYKRENISFSVHFLESKVTFLTNFILKRNACGIVYSYSRREAEVIAKALIKKGIRADFYHAGLEHEARLEKQKKWFQGDIKVIVATNAFGMGIDKDDVRYVIHATLPDSLEGYYQEAGRAGRDGKPAEALLLVGTDDVQNLNRRLDVAFPTIDLVREIYQDLANFFQIAIGSEELIARSFDIAHFADTFGYKSLEVYHSLKVLEESELVILNEMVTNHSKVRITVSPSTIERYCLEKEELGQLVKLMIRNFQGIFKYDVKVLESRLAKQLFNLGTLSSLDMKINSSLVKQWLEKLHLDQVINYEPSNRNPSIVFLGSRLAAPDVPINQEKYQFRKERKKNAAREIVRYAKSSSCRQSFIIQYFGERDDEPCGKCDNCAANKETIDEKEIATLVEQIRQFSGHSPFTIKDILKDRDSMQVHRAITHLEREGIIKQEGEYFRWLVKN